MIEKSEYEQGWEDGFKATAYHVLDILSLYNEHSVADVARVLGVTHSEMVDVAGEEGITFEPYIEKNEKNSKYWNEAL